MTTKTARQHARMLRAERTALPLPPESWNVAPTSLSLVVRQDAEKGPCEDVMAWGFQTREDVPSLFNARIETANAKPSFRNAWKNHHLVVPVNGWYEWQAVPSGKQPFFFHRPADASLFLAGLWDRRTFTLLTMDADGPLATVHDRRPVGLDTESAQRWIEGDFRDWNELVSRAIHGEGIAFHPVSRRVNRAGVDGPDLVDAVEIEKEPEQGTLL